MSRSRIFALALCLFSLVVGARWALCNRYGTDLPEWDQWDAEGLKLLHPLATGQLHFGDFLEPHNEHRIVLTRLLAFVLVRSNGQWDQRLEAMVNALLPGIIAASLWLLAAPRLGRRRQMGLLGALAALYALPVAWQNILSGFDSQQFFLAGLALGAIGLLPFAAPFRRGWWGGAACVLLSLGSMGSGFFAAGVVGALLVFQVGRGTRPLRSAVPGLVVCAVALAVGVMTRAIVPGNDALRAQALSDLFMTAVKALGWPAFDFNWGFASLLLFVPWAMVAARTWRRRNSSPDRWSEFLSGLGLWVVLQALATAYARGNGGPSPASRYVDTLVIGSIVNLLCLSALWPTPAWTTEQRTLGKILVWGWVFFFTLGTGCAAYRSFSAELPPEHAYHDYSERNVRNYLATGDHAYLRHEEIPYPVAGILEADLRLPGIVERLPISVRVPLALPPDRSDADGAKGFFRYDSRVPERLDYLPRVGRGISPATPVLSNAITWGSFGGEGLRTVGVWRSRPLRAALGGWLKFEVAGDANGPGVALELHCASTDQVLSVVRVDKSPGNSWRSAYVRAPQGDFIVVARDESRTGWLAFSEPLEMSRGSYWAWHLARQGGLIATLAGALGLGLLALPIKRT